MQTYETDRKLKEFAIKSYTWNTQSCLGLPDISGNARYFTLPVNRGFSKLNWVRSGIKKNTFSCYLIKLSQFHLNFQLNPLRQNMLFATFTTFTFLIMRNSISRASAYKTHEIVDHEDQISRETFLILTILYWIGVCQG